MRIILLLSIFSIIAYPMDEPQKEQYVVNLVEKQIACIVQFHSFNQLIIQNNVLTADRLVELGLQHLQSKAQNSLLKGMV